MKFYFGVTEDMMNKFSITHTDGKLGYYMNHKSILSCTLGKSPGEAFPSADVLNKGLAASLFGFSLRDTDIEVSISEMTKVANL